MTTTSDGIDWQEAYARLERARELVERTAEPSPDDRLPILRERARMLAQPIADEAPARDQGPELLVFSLAGERYGIETAQVLEVLPLGDLTAVPCTPPVVLGVVNHRGRILAALDLGRLLGPADHAGPAGEGVARRVIVVEVAGMTFGVVADAVTGIVRVAGPALASPLGAQEDQGPRFVRGVTADMIGVLDLEAVARDGRILVNDEGARSTP